MLAAHKQRLIALPKYTPGHNDTVTHIGAHNSITNASWTLSFVYDMRKALITPLQC